MSLIFLAFVATLMKTILLKPRTGFVLSAQRRHRWPYYNATLQLWILSSMFFVLFLFLPSLLEFGGSFWYSLMC
ncbi:hypothetical protein HID58_031866 [Brassica napus]|uniref:Uncharacterized protein n=1 Tax=Brassica napus TaxID=3708 RepID=A0ABQ8BWB6_BRANA|nr:hypothetical protein HID58_031866 [Brassica napus]